MSLATIRNSVPDVLIQSVVQYLHQRIGSLNVLLRNVGHSRCRAQTVTFHA
jgi:hypothetical protein